jgi:hypothetical protein
MHTKKKKKEKGIPRRAERRQNGHPARWRWVAANTGPSSERHQLRDAFPVFSAVLALFPFPLALTPTNPSPFGPFVPPLVVFSFFSPF